MKTAETASCLLALASALLPLLSAELMGQVRRS